MIVGINELETLTKYISRECKYKFDGTKCKSNQWWNNDKCLCKCKKHICKKDYVWNSSTCSCKNGKYLSSHMDDDSIIISVEVIESYNEEIKTIAINANVSIFYKYSY